ncbi:MAG TPA: Ig-like domain-containing protein [Acidimicrobiia bacterium]|nr:Ig-like domain-containing protein [Acidimicrobiia bacterium]
MARHRWRTTAVILGLCASALVGAPGVQAATHVVACDGAGDIAAVQAAVDAAASGDVIRLSGTCDFSAALPHGGDNAGIAATAVLIRPGTPVTDLVIESDGAPHSAAIVGSGTQTAFTVAPGNDRVTIRGLRFVSLARPIAVVGARQTTVGATGGLPAPGGNRIVGNASTDSAVFAVARGSALSVSYGAGGNAGSAVLPAAALEDLSVVGNSITYSPPPPAGFGPDVVGIDVRQAGTGVVDGVTIRGNAVGLFGGDFVGFDDNAVRVEGLAAVPATSPPAPSDYRIRDVVVSGNNFGRFEELSAGSVSGVDPGEVHAAGRVGVLLVRVGEFEVADNMVRARVGTTGPTGDPAGGIVVSDSAFGAVAGNQVVMVFTDATTPETADLGGVAVVEGVPALFGGSAGDQATYGVDVVGNTVGQGARRGIVVSGAIHAGVWTNSVVASSGAALHLGAEVRGPTGTTISRLVRETVACENTLDGVPDAAAEVSYAPGSAPSSDNAFPGGSGVNMPCPPVVTATPAPTDAGDALTVSGRAWASRPVAVTVTDDDGASLSWSGTTAADGAYSTTFGATDVGALADGVLVVEAVAEHPTTRTPPLDAVSAAATVTKNAVSDPPPAGSVALSDGGDGYVNVEEMLAEATAATWTAPSGHVASATVWWSGVGPAPPACGPFVVALSGVTSLPRTCAQGLPDGTVSFHARWTATDGEVSPSVAVSTVKDTSAPVPVILDPAPNSTLTSTSVTVAGTAEPYSGVRVTKRGIDGTYATVAQVTAGSGGSWSTVLVLAEGRHRISAWMKDVAGNQSGTASPVEFTVDLTPPDTTPPAAPVILSPADGAVLPNTFDVSGTAEPGSSARVLVDGVPAAGGVAGANGGWTGRVSLPSGSYTVEADATDAAGNTSARSAPITVVVDTTPPEITVAQPSNGQLFTSLAPVTVAGTASDDRGITGVVLQYHRAGAFQNPVHQVLASCSPACPAPSVAWEHTRTLDPGIYDVVAIAVDLVGNAATRTVRFYKVP